MSSPATAPGSAPFLSITLGAPPLSPPENGSGTSPLALPLASPITSPPAPPAEPIASPAAPSLPAEPIASPPSPPAEPAAPPPSPPLPTPTITPPPFPHTFPPPEPAPLPPSTKAPLQPSTPAPLPPSTKAPLPPSTPAPLPPAVVMPPSPPLITPPTPNYKPTPRPPQAAPSTPSTSVPATKPSPRPQPSTSPSTPTKSSPIQAKPPSTLPLTPPQPPSARRGRNVAPPKTSSPPTTDPPVSSQSPPVSKNPTKPKASESPSNLPSLPISSPGVASSPSTLPVSQPAAGGGSGSAASQPQSISASPAPPGGDGAGNAVGVPGSIVASNDVGKPTVPKGAIVGLCIGGVLLVGLLVFAVLLLVCRRRKANDEHGRSMYAGFEDKTAAHKGISKQNMNQPSNIQAAGMEMNPYQANALGQIIGDSGSSNSPSASGAALGSPNAPGVAISISSGTFSYEELVAATNGFSVSNLLGQGGFGYVHKGILPNGKEVAVKQLKVGGQQGEREFQAEVETISQVHHKHLVSLVGYCIASVERLLVYEFVPNNTMEFHLHVKEQPVMSWETRVKIAVGSAKGFAYLHEDCNPSIIHRDIKASNILLDFNFEAKVSDFGLAKIFSNTSSSTITHITTRVVGTFGYLAPEYASSGKVTDKSDVYSFGVMLLELITGRRPVCATESDTHESLVNWARPLLTQAIADGNYNILADPRLQSNYDANEMASMVACAAACIRLSAWRRPRMSQVIRALQGDLSPSDLDDGIRPGDSSTHFPYESLGFDARQYMENMKKFRMALTSNSNNVSHVNSRYDENTSEYGLQPSASSIDSPQSKATTETVPVTTTTGPVLGR